MIEELEPEELREQQVRQEFGWLYDRLLEVLNVHDIVGLVALGCPKDEYSIEVDELLPLLKDIQSPTQLRHMLYEVFVHMFDETIISHNRYKFEALAKDVWSAYQSWQNITNSDD